MREAQSPRQRGQAQLSFCFLLGGNPLNLWHRRPTIVSASNLGDDGWRECDDLNRLACYSVYHREWITPEDETPHRKIWGPTFWRFAYLVDCPIDLSKKS